MGNVGCEDCRWPLLGCGELWKRATLLSRLLFSVLRQQEASSIVFHFYRALQTLSCVKMKGAPQLSKTVESINEPNTLSLHILIICVTISL